MNGQLKTHAGIRFLNGVAPKNTIGRSFYKHGGLIFWGEAAEAAGCLPFDPNPSTNLAGREKEKIILNRFKMAVLTGVLAISPIIGASSGSAAPANPVSDNDTVPPAAVSVEALSPLDAKRNKVVQTALSLKGQVQYVHWTQRQENHAPYKTDCSGFTYLVYKQANIGVYLINKDDDSQATVGQKIEWGKFEKGDLIFFWNGGSKNKNDVGHVGIYIGDGKMIHNANGKSDVILTNIYNNSSYKERFVVARRVIK